MRAIGADESPAGVRKPVRRTSGTAFSRPIFAPYSSVPVPPKVNTPVGSCRVVADEVRGHGGRFDFGERHLA